MEQTIQNSRQTKQTHMTETQLKVIRLVNKYPKMPRHIIARLTSVRTGYVKKIIKKFILVK